MKESEIIKKALLKLGFPFDDNDLEEVGGMKTASFLLDDVKKDLLQDEEIGITFTTEKLKLTERQVFNGKYEYIIPENCLKVLTPGVTEENGKIYSKKRNLILRYLKEVDLKDIDDKYQKLFVLSLAIELAPTMSKESQISRVYSELELEKEKFFGNVAMEFNIKEMR